MKSRVNLLKTLIVILFGGLLMQACTEKTIPSLTDPAVLRIPIIENHEPLVELKDQKALAYGPSPEVSNNQDYTKLRKSVYDKLIQAQALLPNGLRLCLYEGYRSLSLQKFLFEGRFSKVKSLHPDWSNKQLFNETLKLVSPIVNQDGSKNIPPHSTGGAIDVYLVNEAGQPVPMGIEVKDWMEDGDGSLSLSDSQKISAEARAYRKIMSDALEAVGFANYPHEYWHWSYGDRYWAHQTGHPAAIYGSIE